MLRSFLTAKENIQMQSVVTFVSVLTNTLTFFLLSVFLMFAFFSNYLLNYLESRSQVTVYFQDSATEENILDIRNELLSLPEVTDVSYTSKEEALEIFLELYESEPLLIESVDAGIFPASLDVRVQDISNFERIPELLRTKEGIEEISYFREALEKFKSWSNGVKYIGAAIVGAGLLISFLIILIVTGVSIRDKSEEIRIMRLLGATNGYIQGPFFAQSFLISLLSSLFSVALFMAFLPFVEPFIRQSFSEIPLPAVGFLTIGYIFGIQFLLNIFLSFLGTFVAVKKYMNL